MTLTQLTPRPVGTAKQQRRIDISDKSTMTSSLELSSGCSSGDISDQKSSAMTIQRLQCFKTKRCRFWLEGRCTRGDRCTYAHTDVELRIPPDLTKTKICTRWKRGTCDKSPGECAYAHGLEELRDSAVQPEGLSSRSSQTACSSNLRSRGGSLSSCDDHPYRSDFTSSASSSSLSHEGILADYGPPADYGAPADYGLQETSFTPMPSTISVDVCVLGVPVSWEDILRSLTVVYFE